MVKVIAACLIYILDLLSLIPRRVIIGDEDRPIWTAAGKRAETLCGWSRGGVVEETRMAVNGRRDGTSLGAPEHALYEQNETDMQACTSALSQQCGLQLVKLIYDAQVGYYIYPPDMIRNHERLLQSVTRSDIRSRTSSTIRYMRPILGLDSVITFK
jgi:hypothetical protein